MATFYVDPDGDDSNTGLSVDTPLATLQAAHELVGPGDTIIMRGGIYDMPMNESTDLSTNGTSDAPITLRAYEGERPILDASAWDRGDREAVISHSADHWHVDGIEVTGGPFIGYVAVNANNNNFENLNIYENEGSGFYLYGESSDNLILNGDFHHNFDPLTNGQHADGINISHGTGEGNVVDGVRVFNNADDGIDLWNFDGDVTIQNSYFYGNGIDRWDFGSEFEGNGNGLKLGGGDVNDSTNLSHLVINNMAWDNGLRGFDFNFSDGQMVIQNNTSFNNENLGFHFNGGSHSLTNNISFEDPRSHLINDASTHQNNSWNDGFTVSVDDFLSLDPSDLTGPREVDGSVPASDFLKLSPESELIDAGIDVGLDFSGAAPDLGANEFRTPEPASVSGRVFDDHNENALEDADEVGVAGIAVTLFGVGDAVVAQTLTDSDGHYVFEGLSAGEVYSIQFSGVDKFSFVDPNVGNNEAIDSDAVLGDDGARTDAFTLRAGENLRDLDAGLFDPQTTGDGIDSEDEDANGHNDEQLDEADNDNVGGDSSDIMTLIGVVMTAAGAALGMIPLAIAGIVGMLLPMGSKQSSDVNYAAAGDADQLDEGAMELIDIIPATELLSEDKTMIEADDTMEDGEFTLL